MVAIIGLLIAILRLSPVKAKEQAKMVPCSTTMRQIGPLVTI